MRCVAVCKVTQFESAAKSLFMYTYMHMHLYRYRMDAGKVRHATRQTDATCYKLSSGIWPVLYVNVYLYVTFTTQKRALPATVMH